MNILNKMSTLFKIEVEKEGATEKEIQDLLSYASIEVPEEFLEIIREKTEIEICVNHKKYIRIWGGTGCIEMNDSYKIQKYIPNSLAIADDECCNVLLYANGKEGFGLYMVSLSDLDAEEMVYISRSLKNFFVSAEGVKIFQSIW